MLNNCHKLRKVFDLNNRTIQSFYQFYSTKPFYYQELFEHAKPLNTPFKKLTGINLILNICS